MKNVVLFDKIKSFLNLNFFTDKRYISVIWLIIGTLSALKHFFGGPSKYNNYLIFKNVYYHTINKLSLYAEYPSEYFDHNHYGPVFSLVIAPFAILPDYLGLPLWGFFNALILVCAIFQLPIKASQINAVLWICVHEFLTATLGVQFNPIMTALIIFSFVFIQKEKDFWSAMFIVLGLFIKLYGVVGLAFFFFSKHKIKFILSLFFWILVFFLLPMLISSPHFILSSYQEWFERLVVKNNENGTLNSYQDICVMGMVRRVFHDSSISNLPFLVGGVLLFGMQYIRINAFKSQAYQLLLLASVLIFTVIFSSGSESPTYIIAFVGVAIWFVIQPKPKSKWHIALFIFAMLLTSFSPSDLIPKFVRENFIRPYALKALPCVLVWLVIVYELLYKKFQNYRTIFS